MSLNLDSDKDRERIKDIVIVTEFKDEEETEQVTAWKASMSTEYGQGGFWNPVAPAKPKKLSKAELRDCKMKAGMIAREEVVTKAQDPVTIQAKLQELELAQAVGVDMTPEPAT